MNSKILVLILMNPFCLAGKRPAVKKGSVALIAAYYDYLLRFALPVRLPLRPVPAFPNIHRGLFERGVYFQRAIAITARHDCAVSESI